MSNRDYFESIYGEVSFSRLDESDDTDFFQSNSITDHLDICALKTIEELIEQLTIEESPAILDMMAGQNSHLPSKIMPSSVTGLGLNRKEMEANSALTEITIQDLNKNTVLPYPDNTFDLVLNVISFNFIIKPVEIFSEVARVLKPGGLFLVVFSNRIFKEKTIRAWREGSDQERSMYLEDLFGCTEDFGPYTVFNSLGRPRPADDKYAEKEVASDPVYAVYAEKKGAAADRKERPRIKHIRYGKKIEKSELNCRLESVGETFQCPHCSEKLVKWKVPDHSTSTWAGSVMHVCFNDSCPKFINGFDVMCDQGNVGYSFRFMYDPENDSCKSLPVNNHDSMKEGIVEEKGLLNKVKKMFNP